LLAGEKPVPIPGLFYGRSNATDEEIPLKREIVNRMIWREFSGDNPTKDNCLYRSISGNRSFKTIDKEGERFPLIRAGKND
jgi:hypothetical protein